MTTQLVHSQAQVIVPGVHALRDVRALCYVEVRCVTLRCASRVHCTRALRALRALRARMYCVHVCARVRAWLGELQCLYKGIDLSSYGLNGCDLSSWGLNRYDLNRYGLNSHGLNSDVLSSWLVWLIEHQQGLVQHYLYSLVQQCSP